MSVAVEGILADETAQMVTVAPEPGSMAAAAEAGIYCLEQGKDYLYFMCLNGAPSVDVEMLLSWQNANYVASTITFTINGNAYVNVGTEDAPNAGKAEFIAEEGMTWAEWVESDYNTIAENLYINSDGYVSDTTDSYVIFERGTDRIVAGGEYTFGYA